MLRSKRPCQEFRISNFEFVFLPTASINHGARCRLVLLSGCVSLPVYGFSAAAGSVPTVAASSFARGSDAHPRGLATPRRQRNAGSPQEINLICTATGVRTRFIIRYSYAVVRPLWTLNPHSNPGNSARFRSNAILP